MTILELWFWFVALPALSAMASFLWLAIAFLIIVGFFAFMNNQLEKKFVKPFVILVFIAFVMGLAPSEKQALLVSGAYAVSNNEEIAKLPDNVAKAANAYLGKILSEQEKGAK